MYYPFKRIPRLLKVNLKSFLKTSFVGALTHTFNLRVLIVLHTES